MAICFGTFPPERNGGADFVARLAGALAEQDVRVHVLTSALPGGRVCTENTPTGLTVHRIFEDWSVVGGRTSLRRANAVLEAERVDVLHVLFPDSDAQGRYQLPPLIGLRRTPLVTTFWNLGLGRRSPTRVRLASLALLARSAVLSSHDPAYLRALRRLVVGRKPVRWLPVGSNFVAAPRASRRDGTVTLGYFGQLDFTRGVDTLFDAIARLDRDDVRLRMLGSAGRPERYRTDPRALAEFERLRALPARLGIAGVVEWTGFLSDDEVTHALAGLDLAVLPYRRNSIGRSALAAALAARVPVVLGGRPDAVEPLVPGEHVALVPPDDPGALAAVIEALAGDEGERRRLAAGAERAAEFFAWPRVAAKALELYRLALGRRA